MQGSMEERCKESGLEYLLEQWHPKKNGDLTPAMVLAGSHKKVWWRCEKGHEWQAEVRSRMSGRRCPICTNRVVNPGENDLGTTHPELAAQWHSERNGALTPAMVFAGSDKKVWWRCEKGHEWQASVGHRTINKSGCAVCAGKVVVPGVNDLASAFLEIAREWHPEKNGELTPEKVSAHSNRRVWWQCRLSHEWQAEVNSRISGRGCPYCGGRKVLAGFNDLQTVMPELAAQWHPALNGELTAQMVTIGSNKKVWWECPLGHVWKSVVYARTGGRKNGCPACAGKVKEDRQLRYAQAQEAGQAKKGSAGN